jgi:RNA polymerase sigma-70 factor (ECF subfamily)
MSLDPDVLAAELPGLVRYARYLTRNPADADDLGQDTLERAVARGDTFRGDSSPTTWLHRVVVNACLARLRRIKSKPTVPLPDHDSAHPVEPSDPIGRRELAMEIGRALASIPADQRAALVLVDVEGFSVDEAAAILDCPPGTVKSRCARGRAKLVPLLQHLRNPDAAAPVTLKADQQPGSDSQRGSNPTSDRTSDRGGGQ